MAILAGMNSAPIHRLKRTWEMVPSKVNQILDSLKAAMDNKHNFSAYRKLLQQGTGSACVPFLGDYFFAFLMIRLHELRH
jgi:son of sevenless-like protein